MIRLTSFCEGKTLLASNHFLNVLRVRCVSWELGEDGVWSDGAILNVHIEGVSAILNLSSKWCAV